MHSLRPQRSPLRTIATARLALRDLDTARQALRDLARNRGARWIKAILDEFGAETIGDLPPRACYAILARD